MVRRMSTEASTYEMPSPDHVRTPAEFVAAMRTLRQRAKLTYRELESKAHAAGDRLPRGTIASALSRGRIPHEQTIASFVRACGGDRKAVERWLAARRRVARADQAVIDLATAVETWVTARWQVRAEQTDLATAVESWLTTRRRGTTPKPTVAGYAQGRLAEAVAGSRSGRWRGLHRRPRRRTLLRAGVRPPRGSD
jgi:hypothetical protein